MRQREAARRYTIPIRCFFFLWPFVAPVYLFRTRGWDALAPIGLFLLLQLGGLLFAALLGYPRSIAYFQAHLR